MEEAQADDKKPSGGSHSVRRIRRIAEHVDARTYLEVGVAKGRTFNALTFDRKVAVDPRFRFDIADHRKAGVDFHELTSDRYFSEYGALQKFDIVFLDGLHTFQQTLRDFCNSLACAHARTVWLIDDVLPIDVFSAWPVQKEAYQFRKRAGGDSAAWHGDVFKVVFFIHDFFPMFRYVTFKDQGNPQTLVWKAPQANFAPIFDSLEAIERLSYFDLLKRETVLNLQSEEDGFGLFLASLRGSHEGGAGSGVSEK